VLGSILIDGTVLIDVEPILKPADFYRNAHCAIYESLLSLYGNDTPVDFVTICDELDRQGKLSAVGGAAYLTSLLSVVPTAVHAEHYAKIVKRAAVLRQIIATAQAMAVAAYDEQDPKEIAEQASGRLSVVISERLEDKYSWSAVETSDYTEKLVEKYGKEWEANKEPYPTIPWVGIAQFVPWLRPGLPAVLAAPTGSGKTMLVENLAEHWAREGWNVVFFHYELPTETLIARRFARKTGTTITQFEKGLRTVGGHREAALAEVSEWVTGWKGNLQYVHCEGWPLRRVVAEAESLWRQGLCDVMIVDYLSKAPFVPYVKGETPAQTVGHDVNLVKNFCEKRRVCAVLVSQYNNAGTFRNSGEIGQLVNVVIEAKKAGDDILKVDVTKNTLGPTGGCILHVDFARFRVKE